MRLQIRIRILYAAFVLDLGLLALVVVLLGKVTP